MSTSLKYDAYIKDWKKIWQISATFIFTHPMKGTTEDEMVGWHHQLNGHEFEQASGDGEGQGSLVCYSPWGCKESDVTERLSNKNNNDVKE